MHADDKTLYMSATTVEDLSATLNKELQLVSDWVKNNRMVLNKIHCINLTIYVTTKSKTQFINERDTN